MSNIRNTLVGICMAALSVSALAQNVDEHKGHHPEGTTPPAAATQKVSPQPMAAGRMAAMDQKMKAMQAMHDKMMAAKTPEERQALMAEHMKTMQDGMAMMKEMGGMSKMAGMQGGKEMSGSMSECHQMMEKSMEMMESMMQMMMDRTAPAPAAK